MCRDWHEIEKAENKLGFFGVRFLEIALVAERRKNGEKLPFRLGAVTGKS